jgi:hypothetical protein
VKIGSIVIRCYEFDKMMAFWQEALHYVPREPAEAGWVVLRDPAGRGPNCPWIGFLNGAQANGAGCTSLFCVVHRPES